VIVENFGFGGQNSVLVVKKGPWGQTSTIVDYGRIIHNSRLNRNGYGK
jgi:hypothetical protein